MPWHCMVQIKKNQFSREHKSTSEIHSRILNVVRFFERFLIFLNYARKPREYTREFSRTRPTPSRVSIYSHKKSIIRCNSGKVKKN